MAKLRELINVATDVIKEETAKENTLIPPMKRATIKYGTRTICISIKKVTMDNRVAGYI